MTSPTIAFFRHLHRGGQFAYYHALPERRSYWYATDRPLAPPVEALSNWYISVHPATQIPPANAHGEIKDPPYVRAQKRYVAALNCLYGEYDVKDYGSKDAIAQHIASAPWPRPSVVVDSGGGIHCYWLLRDPWGLPSDDARLAAEIVQRAWVCQVIGADKTVHDLVRILRVPGTLNFKYDPPRPVEYLSCDLDCQYSLAALTAHLPAVHEAEPKFKNDPPRKANSIDRFNRDNAIGDVLARYGYRWAGARRMISPDSGSARPGVTIDSDTNRAYVHTGGDALSDGYWKKPFDVIRLLECGGDFSKALEQIREH
jgi:hypothetical protein